MKKFVIPGDKIVRLVPMMGYCIASDFITVEGKKINYMYREKPDREDDSGWRFFSGLEDEEYTSNPSHFKIYDVNTIANHDQDIIPFLEKPYGVQFERTKEGIFDEIK